MRTLPHLFGCAFLAIAIRPGIAQEKPSSDRFTTEHYFELERVSDAQISPDGARIVYTRQQANRLEDKWESSVWIMNADGSQHRFLAKGNNARWASDSKRILYLADGEPRGTQIFVRWIDAEGPATQVTHTTEKVGDAHWSPDGKMIAFSMFVPDKNKWTISMPAAPDGAKWTTAPRIVETLHYRQDQVGFLEDGNTHLFLVAADGGAPRQLTNGKWSVGAGELRGAVAMDWTPESKAIVFQANRDANSDLEYQRSELLVWDATSGSIRDLVTKPGVWSRPAVSPDGKLVAFTGYPESTSTHSVADLYVVPFAGGEPRKISGAFDRDPINLHWTADGSGVYFDADDHGARNVQLAAINGGVRLVTNGKHMLTMDSVSKDMVAAGTMTDSDHPAEVVRYGLRAPTALTQLSNVNAGLLARKRLANTEEINYTSSGNTKVQGWIVKPPDFDNTKKYPLILEIHGGPYGNFNVGFNYMWQNFAANNFVVLYVNPRGSTGYGTAFSGAINHNYPGPDYDDLMAGVDAVISKGFVDTSRMYVSGCSGGGILSSWVIGHTDRFAAAAVRCPVIDWLSLAGDTDIPLFTYSFFQKPFWEDPSDWLSHSPLMYVGNVSTPTLLMTAVLDRRTPMPQTEEYYAALKKRGIPVKLLQFEGEYHGTVSKPSNFIRTQLYMMSWFNEHTRSADKQFTSSAAADGQ